MKHLRRSGLIPKLRDWLALCALCLAAASGQSAWAQNTRVTGTFLTQEGKTPAQAGLKVVATIAGTSVYAKVTATVHDLSAYPNQARELSLSGITYYPGQVLGFIKSDGTLIDYAAAAGIRLIPTLPASPSGLVYCLEIKWAASTDGRLPATTLSGKHLCKAIPDQASADWASLAVAAITTPAVNYQLQTQGQVTDWETVSVIAAASVTNPPASNVRVFYDSSNSNKLTRRNSDGTLTVIEGGGGGGGSLTVEEQDGAPSVASVTTLRFDQADGLVVSTPGAGIARVDLAAIPDGALASNYSGVGACAANQWASTLNDNAAPTCTQPGFANLSGAATDAQVPNNITIATLDTTFEVQDNLDTTKILQLQLSSIATATTRTWTAPNASGEVTLLGQTIEDAELASNYSGVGACAANNVVTGVNDNAAPSCVQLTFGSIAGTATKGQLPAAVAYEDEANIYTVAGAVTLDNQLGVRLREADAGGDEYIELRAPAAITTSLTLTLNVTGQCTGTNGGALTINASNEIVCTDDDGGAGSGDNVSVNGVAATNADFDDATPAAPANAVNVKWQKDALDPTNISAHLLLTDVDGAGIGVSGTELVTASSETGFLASGALTCGASTAGRMQAHTTPLQYCDNAGTPALQYAAYGNSSGAATTGDAASGFFPDDLPVADGGTGASTATAARGNLGVHYGLAYGLGAFNPADATTYIIGNQAAPDANPGDNTKHQIAAPIAGTVKRLCISGYVGGTLGSGESVSFFVRKLGTTDSTESVSVTLNTTEVAIACANLTTTFTVAEDDKVSLKMVSPTWVTNPTNWQVRWSIKILQDQ